MRKITKLLSITMAFVLILTAFATVPASAEVLKGTARVVIADEEWASCEDTVVYDGIRYLPIEYVALPYEADYEIGYAGTDYNFNNNSATIQFTSGDYISFWAGSTKMRIDESDLDDYLYYPAIMYDGQMYVSMEDLAYELYDCNYGYDVSANTFYFY